MSSHDRSGDQLRKKCNVKRVIEQVAICSLLPPVNINHIRDALKGVEANTQGQNNVDMLQSRIDCYQLGD